MSNVRMHYGWIISLGCGITLFYSLGLAFNCFSIFIDPLIETLDLTKTEASSIASVFNIGALLSMLIAGSLCKKFGARIVAYVSGLLMAIGFLVFSFSYNLILCYVAAIIIGLGYGSGSMIPVSVLLTKWFHTKRGTALGIASAGTGISTFIYPPILTLIINRYDVSGCFVFIFLNILILATISFFLIKNDPCDKNLIQYGVDYDDSDLNLKEEEGILLKEAIKTKKYYLLIIAEFSIGITLTPTIAHITVIFTTNGYNEFIASFFLSIFGITMLFSKPLYGYIIDIFGILKSNIYIYFFWTFSLSSALLIGKSDIIPYVFVITSGLGIPLSTVALPIWISFFFGKKDIASIYSTFIFTFTLGSIIGMILPGLMADLTGSYLPVFIVFSSLSVLSFIIIQYQTINQLKHEKKNRRSSP